MYEGEFKGGVPNGFGSVVDQHTNHYEGVVLQKDDTILGNGVGTLYFEKQTIKGTFFMGYLKVAEDKSQQTVQKICDFQEAFTSITHPPLTGD